MCKCFILNAEFAELFAKFHDLMIRAEDAEEKEAVIRKTEEMKRKRQFHPCRSAKEEFEDGIKIIPSSSEVTLVHKLLNFTSGDIGLY